MNPERVRIYAAAAMKVGLGGLCSILYHYAIPICSKLYQLCLKLCPKFAYYAQTMPMHYFWKEQTCMGNNYFTMVQKK